MDIKNWRRSISTRSIRLGKHYDRQLEPEPNNNNNNNKKKIRAAPWKVLWRKFLKENKNVFVSSSRGGRVHVQSPYDSETYMQNFDEGQTSLIEEPDVVFRSFSMRFADPSKLFPQEDLILI